MRNQFMLLDLLRIAGAVLLYANILIAPGYVLAWLINAFEFRTRSIPTRLAISLTSSIGICPVLTYLMSRGFPAGVWLLYGSAVIAFLILLFAAVRHRAWPPISKRRTMFFILAAAWAIFAMLTLSDLQLGHRLYFPVVTFDYALRADVTSAITRSGIPPPNPLFFPGHPYPLRYHYFWYILCSLVSQAGGHQLSARVSIIAGAIWCGIGLMALIPLYLRFFQPAGKHNIDRRGLIGIALLCVTGLDIFPVLFVELSTKKLIGSIEWWNEQITAWANVALWVPHHLASLIACLTGFLLLWDTRRKPNLPHRLLLALAAGCMFASATGLSIYVTFVFAICLGVWLVIALIRKQWTHGALICVSGCITVLLSIPFLLELLGKAGAAPGGTSQLPFELHVRKFPLLLAILGIPAEGWKSSLVNLVSLPLNYFLELGFFFIAGLIWCGRLWRKRRGPDESQLCAFAMAATSIVVCSFVRSSVIGANDLGWRGFMIAQFILLLWGAELLSEGLKSQGEVRILLVMALLFGAAGTAYDVLKIRFLPVLSDMTPAARVFEWLSPDDRLGERTYAMRQIYEQLRRRVPVNAVLQHNPDVNPQDNFHGMYADRQIAAETMSCGVVFGGDEAECKARIEQIAELFRNPAIDPASIDERCRSLSIDVLVVQKNDPVWPVTLSWVWKRTPLLANDYGRVFTCGSNTKPNLP